MTNMKNTLELSLNPERQQEEISQRRVPRWGRRDFTGEVSQGLACVRNSWLRSKLSCGLGTIVQAIWIYQDGWGGN